MSHISRRTLLGATGGLALAGASHPPAQAAGEHRFALVTANIGRQNKEWRKPAIHKIRWTFTGDFGRPMVGWQEIGEGDQDTLEFKWIREKFATPPYRHRYLEEGYARSAVPLSIPREFVVKAAGSEMVHEGRAGITPRRFVNWAELEWHDDPTLKVAFVNTHFVAGAFNNKYPATKAWRRARWDEHFDHLRKVIKDRIAKGMPVLWTGDVNRPDMPRLVADEYRPFASGIDQIGIVNPSSVRTKVRYVGTAQEARGTLDLKVDSHDARYVKLHILNT